MKRAAGLALWRRITGHSTTEAIQPNAMKSGLQRRLLLLLLVPLTLVAMISVYFDYRMAGNVALQQDQRLLRLLPLLADSVLSAGADPNAAPVMILAPEIEEFIKNRNGLVGFRLSDPTGKFLLGDAWIGDTVPTTSDPEFHSMQGDGVTYRIAVERVKTAAGDLIVSLADGSDARQQWVRSIWVKVLLPNVVLLLAAAVAVNWAVTRALRPLLALKDAVERRSPRDLSTIDPLASPAEVQPLVSALNRLFGLFDDQAEAQRRFVADAAHQLRTPLAGLQAQIEAWAQTAQASDAGGAVTLSADTLIKLRDATRRTSQLANQLLALSRADASVLSAQALQPVDLKELCETILPMYLDKASAKRIDLGLEAAPALAAGHAWLLHELLANLVDNAVNYTPFGGAVTIRCGMLPVFSSPGDASGLAISAATPPRVFLEVEDDGPGIAPAERAKALQRFYRVLGSSGEGNGLGLAIADEIARVHGAQLALLDACGDAQTPSRPGEAASPGLLVRLVLAAAVPVAESAA